MNVAQALLTIFPELPETSVLEPGPYPVPDGMYFVVSELVDADQDTYHAGIKSRP